MNIINTKGSSDNFLNSVPLKVKGQNTIITKETVVNGQSQTIILDGQTAYNELKTQQDTNINNISNLQNTLDQNYYTKEETDEAIASQMSDQLKQNLQFAANKAIYTGADGYVTASDNVSRFDIEVLNGLNNELAARNQTTLTERLSAIQDLALEPSPKAELNKTGTVKIANNLTTSSFNSSDPVALSACKGYDLQTQITSLQQDLSSVKTNYYNAVLSRIGSGYLKRTYTTPDEYTSSIEPFIAGGIPAPTETRDSTGLILCWPAADYQYFKTTGWNSIVFKEPGQYFIMLIVGMRSSYNNDNYATIASGADVYNYISRELSMRIRVQLDRTLDGGISWERLYSLPNLTGSGANDTGITFTTFTTTESNTQLCFRLFSNNPFREDNETKVLSARFTVMHLHSTALTNS